MSSEDNLPHLVSQSPWEGTNSSQVLNWDALEHTETRADLTEVWWGIHYSGNHAEGRERLSHSWIQGQNAAPVSVSSPNPQPIPCFSLPPCWPQSLRSLVALDAGEWVGKAILSPALLKTILPWACLGHMTTRGPSTAAQLRSGLLWVFIPSHVSTPGPITVAEAWVLSAAIFGHIPTGHSVSYSER